MSEEKEIKEKLDNSEIVENINQVENKKRILHFKISKKQQKELGNYLPVFLSVVEGYLGGDTLVCATPYDCQVLTQEINKDKENNPYLINIECVEYNFTEWANQVLLNKVMFEKVVNERKALKEEQEKFSALKENQKENKDIEEGK